MGWFHKKCVNELKWKSMKSLIDPNFKFICKECIEFHQKSENEIKIFNSEMNLKDFENNKKEEEDILIEVKEKENVHVVDTQL
jgi:hypothetical protein